MQKLIFYFLCALKRSILTHCEIKYIFNMFSKCVDWVKLQVQQALGIMHVRIEENNRCNA